MAFCAAKRMLDARKEKNRKIKKTLVITTKRRSSPRWRIPRSIHQFGRTLPLAFSRPCGGKADCPRKEKHDHKTSNDLADWKWETTRWRLPRRAEKRLPGEAGRITLHVGTTTKSTWARKKKMKKHERMQKRSEDKRKMNYIHKIIEKRKLFPSKCDC